MLAKPHEYFARAMTEHFAMGAFNSSNLELTQAIAWAARDEKAPVIIQTSEGAIEYAGLKVLAQIIKSVAAEVDVPIIMHLDHGKKVDVVKACIDAGYTSVMIDAATLPLDKNIATVKEVVEYAHDRGVWVEAELGAIVGKEGIKDLHGQQTPDDFLTKPEQAKQFIDETGINSLAVSVGTIHGAFTGQEYIRFELLDEIQKTVPGFPLVIHGASGIADEHLKRAVAMSVCKVNVDTELRIAFEQAVKAYFDQSHDSVDPRKILGPAREAVQMVAASKIRLFGGSGKK